MADRTEPKLSHVAADGSAKMVDVADKAETSRRATAKGEVRMSADALELVRSARTAKGNVIETARIAAILGAKRTSELIPLCHPLGIDHVDVAIREIDHGLEIEATVRCRGRTGVEMEALTAVSMGALTIYDMVKAVDKTMVIGEVRLIEKHGGKSGTFVRDDGE